jgi:hypothetical protein
VAFVAVAVGFVDFATRSSNIGRPSSHRESPTRRPRLTAGPAAIPPPTKRKTIMTADAFRTVSTCVAAMFVSMMLVAAATSTSLVS